MKRTFKSGFVLGLVLQATGALAGTGGLLWAAPGTGGIYVDDSPAATETFDRARGLVNQKRYVEAVGLLMRLSREHEGRLIGTGPGRYADITVQVRQTLQSDERLLSAYRSEVEPEAAKALAKVREEGLAPERLRGVMDRYWLTKTGLVAALDLTAVMIAKGDFAQARWLIAQAQTHPDAKGQAGRMLSIQIAMARLMGDKSGLAALLEEAKTPELAGAAQTGQGWTKVPAGGAEVVVGKGEQGEPVLPKLADLKKLDLKTPLWEFSLRSTYLDEAQLATLQMQGFPVKELKLPFSVKPLVNDGQVLINTGLKVIALDQLSGRMAWTHTAMPISANDGQQMQMALARSNRMLPETRGVAVHGDKVMAVVGYSPFLLDPWVVGRMPSALVCLEKGTGKQLWRYNVPQADPKLGRTMLSGTPVVLGDTVYAVFCRPNAGRNDMGTGQSELYLGAFNVETGEPIWTRYILASGRLWTSGRAETAQVVVEGSDLLVLDASGALARLDAKSGQIRWLSTPFGESGKGADTGRGFISVNPQGGQGEAPWSESEPIRLPAGLLVKFPGSDQLSVIDIATGQSVDVGNKIKTLDSDSIAQVGENFILSSKKLQLIDGATLKRRWETALPAPADARSGTLPWPARVAQDVVALPMGLKLYCFDLETGTLVDSLAMAGPGDLNIRELDAIQADRETVRYFMPWEGAIAQIQKRAKDQPDDPRTGMSLAYLGFRKQDAKVTGQGLELIARSGMAIKAARAVGAEVNAADVRSQAMVDFLISFSGPGANPSMELRKSVLETLEKIVQTPGQEVEYRLSLIDFLKQSGQAAAAVAQAQVVLGDASLASQQVARGPISQRAELWARSVLGALIEQNGVGIYASFDAQAKGLLDAQMLSGAPDADACQRIAERFPFAQATPRALYLAGAGKMAKDPVGSSRLLARAYMLGKKPEDMELILSKLVEVNLRLNQQTRAMGWLRRAQREYPGMMVYRQDVKIAPEAWMAHLQSQAAPTQDAGAVTGLMRQGTQLVEMLLPMPIEGLDRETISKRYVVAQDKSNVVLVNPATLAKSEPRPIQGMAGPVSLVFQDNDRFCLWMPQVKRLVFYNVTEGLGLNSGPGLNINQVLESAGNDQSRQEQMSPELRGLEGMLNGRGGVVIVNGRVMSREQAMQGAPKADYIGVNDSVVVIADGNGRVCAIDRSTAEVAWKLLLPMELLDSISVSSDAVVLKGALGRLKGDDQTGVVVVLDPLTGEQRMPVVETAGPVTWAGVTGDGYLVYLSEDQAVSRPVKLGGQIKRTGISRLATRAFFSASSPGVLIQENSATLAMFDPAQGQITGRVSVRPAEDKEPIGAVAMGQGWLAWTKGSLVAIDRTGKVLWKAQEGFPARAWTGVRVQGGGVLAMRAVEQVEAHQGPARPVFLMGPATGAGRPGAGDMTVKATFTEGKVGGDGQLELPFKARVMLPEGRMVWISGVAKGHVSSTPEEKQAKVHDACLEVAGTDVEVGPALKPKGGRQPRIAFIFEKAATDGLNGGMMYELVWYEAATGRLMGRQVFGSLREQVEGETWVMTKDRMFMDKLRPKPVEDPSGNRAMGPRFWNVDDGDF
jgi:outer membrane protein assembly factor BamB